MTKVHDKITLLLEDGTELAGTVMDVFPTPNGYGYEVRFDMPPIHRITSLTPRRRWKRGQKLERRRRGARRNTTK